MPRKIIKGFTAEAEKQLVEYNWPGNVRELKNVVERCVVLANSELISPETSAPGIVRQRRFAVCRKTQKPAAYPA